MQAFARLDICVLTVGVAESPLIRQDDGAGRRVQAFADRLTSRFISHASSLAAIDVVAGVLARSLCNTCAP